MIFSIYSFIILLSIGLVVFGQWIIALISSKIAVILTDGFQLDDFVTSKQGAPVFWSIFPWYGIGSKQTSGALNGNS